MISDARCVDAHLDALDVVHVTGCAIIKDLSGYQQSNPVSSVAVPAVHPKMEKYLGNSHVGSLIVVKYHYFSHFC